MFIKNKYDTDYTDVVKKVYKLISDRYGYGAKLTDIWPILSYSYGLDEFEILDTKQYLNGSFEAFLIDEMIEWQKGSNVDFSDICKEIIDTGNFTESEKLKFTCESFEEHLWAIYMAIVDPTMKL